LVGGLYVVILFNLTLPLLSVGFLGEEHQLPDLFEVFRRTEYWVWLLLMGLAQIALLTVPVRVASRRPTSRRTVLLPILAGGLMAAGLAVGAAASIYELVTRLEGPPDVFVMGVLPAIALTTWIGWSIVFARLSRRQPATDVVTRQCRVLLRGSILEFLIAVPTHIVARYRDYCCAGFMTFLGITMGTAVMLYAFGPAVFFLFVGRWRQLHPDKASARTPD
jgi:hypothetical protein